MQSDHCEPWKDHRRTLPFLFGATAIAIFLLPLAANFPLLDPDEGLHASISQEMVEGGDWLVPHFLGKPFRDKPILYFWCQALSLKCFGMNEFAVRLPGLFWGFLGCLTTAFVGRQMFGRTAGLVAGVFYATMILPAALAQAAAHDVMLVPCVNLALLFFWRSDCAKSWKSLTGYAFLIGIVLGASILAKGLLGVALVGITYGSYLLISRRFSVSAWYRGVVSLCVAFAVASIWYLAVEFREPGYLRYYFVERHLMGFATSTQTHGDAPWWLYIPLLLGGGLPWIGYLPVTIRESFDRSAERTATSTRLLWCWLLGCTFFLTVAQSKLATYLWPVFPAAAILASIGWARLLEGNLGATAKRSLCRNFLISSLISPIVLPIVVYAVQMFHDVSFPLPAWSAVILAGLSTLAPLWFFFRQKWLKMLAASLGATAAQFLVIMFLLVPVVAEQHTAKQLAEYCNVESNSNRLLNASGTRSPSFGKMFFVESRIGSFVFYLTPSLRASIQNDRLLEIDRPKEMPKIKRPCPTDGLIVVPENRLAKAKMYLDFEGLSVSRAGRFLLFRKTSN